MKKALEDKLSDSLFLKFQYRKIVNDMLEYLREITSEVEHNKWIEEMKTYWVEIQNKFT